MSDRHHDPTPHFQAPPWTPDMEAKLRELWPLGLSCSKIAKEIGVTKNAVIGKAHRLQLLKRREVGARVFKPPRKPKPRRKRIPVSAKPKPLPPPLRAPDCKPVTLMELGGCMCRYPVGDGFYCGDATDKTFCIWHAARCYNRR